MKPTADDFEPRRDGWFEHVGTWGEVTVGTVISSRKRSERWEIIETSHGPRVEYGYTLWMRAREQTSGAEFTVQPRPKTGRVKILTQDPADTETPEYTPPSDSEALALLVEKLGATHLATRDETTGEITCPDYAAGHLHDGAERGGTKAEMEHLRFAHGFDTTGFESLPFDDRLRAVVSAHGRLHGGQDMSPGGFPHRHVPEDLTLQTGIK